MYMQIRLPMVCFFIITYSLLHYTRKGRLHTVASRVFEMAAFGGVLHTVSAAVTEYTVNNRDKVPEVFNYIWHVIFLLSLSFTCLMIYSYLICHIERGTGRKRKAERIAVNIVYTVCSIAEFFLPIEYIDTPDGSYSLGAKAYALYVVVIYIMVMMIIDLVIYHRVVEREIKNALVCSVFIFVVISVVQIVFPYILLTDAAIVLIVVGIMMNTEDSNMYISYDTGLYNELGCREMLRDLILRQDEFKLGVCVLFGESTGINKVQTILKKRIMRRYSGTVCGTPMHSVFIVMPAAGFSGKRSKIEKIPDNIGDVKCVSDILCFDSSNSIDDIINDITAYKNSCEESEHHTDELTGLLRRSSYSRRVEQLIANKKRFSFIMIDIDNFKNINDTYGHGVGDEVLKYAADIFSSSIRSTDLACRMGGDEFSIVLTGISDEELVRKIASKFTDKMKHTAISDVIELNITMSMGVKMYNPEDKNVTFDELYRESDRALYKAKKSGKNRICISNPENSD